MAIACLLLHLPPPSPPLPFLPISKPKPNPNPILSSLNTHILALNLSKPNSLSLSTTCVSPKPATFRPLKIRHNKAPSWRLYAAPEEALVSDTTTPLETSQQLVSAATGDSTAYIVQALLITAFVALSILTIGVVYIGVTDFLQKRESQKYEKELAAKQKGKKKRKPRARAGPKGFGQKIDDGVDDDFDIDI
ncbi:hypothetical protein Tsubulata_043342 [Turnera subulata]|uniref:Transmembrane protein n=1 Tax=Turnera subulata TaxID=218843 RepID=A0A9Q0FJI9_9ROSI|nr:hypothetical protein Tsubulata_043342 [Turnera subulata]